MSALMTSRFGNFLKEDLGPMVAASLRIVLSTKSKTSKDQGLLPEKTETIVTTREKL
jgi:hypothetical protein